MPTMAGTVMKNTSRRENDSVSRMPSMSWWVAWRDSTGRTARAQGHGKQRPRETA